ncbi:MAG: long-chain fatty acid--CoA ligase [Syntrophomonadaceae bacterium]|nr:long-chain fatty acid--CoA ligase [Syntrophomonadaceae bacterium]NLV23031.1 long-chain fatty acid--CoA ligase [Syntrophomonadaceae bacterium]
MSKPWLKDFEDDLAKWRPRWEALYDDGMPRNFEYPDTPLKDYFNKWAELYPEKPYLLINDIELNYGLVNNMARRTANALLGLGVKKGDRVAIMAPNLPQYVIALQALFKIGAIEVPSNVLYTVPELDMQFKDSGTETVIVMAAFADKAIQLMKDPASPVKRVIAFQIPAAPVEVEKGENIFDFNELITAADEREPDIEVLGSDIAKLQYTGGTTGVPKGCVLTNKMLLSQAIRTSTWCTANFTLVPFDEIKTLAAIPLNHIYGYNGNINACLYTGGTIVLVPLPTPDNILKAINQHEPNIWAAVPAMIIGLNNHPDIEKSKVNSVKGIFSGSAPLAVETMKEFERLSGGRILEGYGLSETINILTVNPVFKLRKYGSCGIVWPDTDLVVVDIDTGTKVMPRGELGELICRGPQVMKEYWNNPEETDIAIRDGWFYTGDIVRMDEDGFVFIVDRKKDMIIASGFNVYPRDIDEVVFAHPKVMEACTIGVPDAKRGETVKVFVALKEGETMTAEELIEHCRTQLAPYKVPTLVEFVESIPRTAVGKADRKALKQMEIAKIEAAATS